MSFLDLNNDVKSIVAEHLSSDYKISTMLMSRYCHLQKSLFDEIVFDDDFHKNKTTPGRMNDDNDFNNANMYKIYNVLNDIL
jgi:hypothetical protein